MAALAMLAVGCGDDDDEGTPDDETTVADDADGGDEGDDGGEAPEALEVSTVDFAFEGLPEEIPGGVVEVNLSNEGAVDHEIAFVEIGDTELDQFLIDFAPVLEGGPTPEYATNIVGANSVGADESASFTYTLSEGTYAVFCTLTGSAEDPEGEEGEPHYDLGMKQLVDVTAPEGETELPEGDGTITAVDYSFETDLSGGDTVINFTNDGPEQLHFAGFDVYPEGTTVEDAEAAFETLIGLEEGQAPPAGTPEGQEVGFSGVATPGNGIQFEVPGGFEAGRTYLFYCFVSDRSGGPPHAIANRMFKAFTIE